MCFTVVWNPSALDELAEIWIQAADKQSVTQAANLIDYTLGNDPKQQGEGNDEQRCWAVHPLFVQFRISKLDCLVKVIRIKNLAKN